MKGNKIPKFRTEAEERKFWGSCDSTKYVDWEKAKEVTLPNLKPSMRSISIRFPEIMIEELKLLAHKRDIPYQSLIKIYISEKVKEDLQKI
jgi:predicted DNA binding CopG/RHH family protein